VVDFVVVGLSLGAIAVLAGVVLIGWTAARAERAAAAAGPGDGAASWRAVAAAAGDAGRIFVAVGGTVFLATGGALAGALDDRTGAFLVVTTFTVAALGMLLWGYRNLARIPWFAARPRRRAAPFTSAEVEDTRPPLPPASAAPLLAAPDDEWGDDARRDVPHPDDVADEPDVAEGDVILAELDASDIPPEPDAEEDDAGDDPATAAIGSARGVTAEDGS
jgi:hypothetical protein